MNSHTQPGILAKFLLMLFGIIFSLLIVELALRLFYPQQTYNRAKALSSAFYIEDEYTMWSLLPNYSGEATLYEGGVNHVYHVDINSLGLRNEEIPPQKPQDTYRILAIGDSFTFGLGVNNGEDYPARLETCLNTHLYGPVAFQVLNRGIGGLAPDRYYVSMREAAPPLAPDLVLVGYYVGNDIIELLDTEWIGEQDGLPERVISKTAIPNLDGQLTYRQTLPRYRIPILRDSHTFQLLMEWLTHSNQSLQGHVPVYVQFADLFNQIYEPTLSPQLQAPFNESLNMLNAMGDLAAQNDYEVMVLLFPDGYQTVEANWDEFVDSPYPANLEDMYPQKAIREYLDRQGIAYFDLLPALAGDRGYYFQPQGHWTPRGTQVAADAICQHLSESRLEDILLNHPEPGLRVVIEANTAQVFLKTDTLDCGQIGEVTAELQPPQLTAPDCPWSVEFTEAGNSLLQLQVSDEGGEPRGKPVYLQVDPREKALRLLPNGKNTLGMSETAYQAYQDYLTEAGFLAADAIIFNPATGEAADQYELKRELVTAIETEMTQGGRHLNALFALLTVVDLFSYQSNLPTINTAEDQLNQWRVDKQAAHLREAGVDYVFFDETWFGWLTPEEAAIFRDPRQYELVQRWDGAELGTYYLYRVVSS
jgi:hypothetical protein